VFDSDPELFRGKRIEPEFFLDISLMGNNRVKTTLLVPRHLLADAIDTVSGYKHLIEIFEVFRDPESSFPIARTKAVQDFLGNTQTFRNMDVKYWPIFKGSEFYKEVQFTSCIPQFSM
jgi:hypothetical protein